MISPAVLFAIAMVVGNPAGPTEKATLRIVSSQGAEPPEVTTPSPGERMSPDFVVIDGAREPERIPEYALWRGAFYLIAHKKRQREAKGTPREPLSIQLPTGDFDRISFTERDALLVEEEAAGQDRRDRTCDAGLHEIIAKLTRDGKNPEEIADALVPAIIDCRWKDLEARDRVLGKMSDEGAMALRNWVSSQRYTSSMTVNKRELPYVMLPQ